ncbi:MAG: RIP metalloprotease RseP [Gammaproteobacteria bacterium]|nr:RIP metalloprotease RseP [Gammaproteobacteria bacterium]
MILLSVLAFIFAIGVLVAVHEWGHYIVARMAGVKVLRFSVGFGRPVWLRRAGPDQTEYCISAIPLGGYVKLLDEREGQVDPAERSRSFNQQSLSARVAILVAGPLMNFIFAVIAFFCMYQVGVPGSIPLVGEVQPDSIAATAGIAEGDRIVAINNSPVATWEGVMLGLLDAFLSDSRATLELRGEQNRAGERTVVLDIGDRLSELTEPGAMLPGLGLAPFRPQLPPVIGEVLPGGAAEAAGMQAGDEVIAVNGTLVSGWMEWVALIRGQPGVEVHVAVYRDGRTESLEMTIGESTDEDGLRIGRIGAGPEVPEDFYAAYRAEQRYTGLTALDRALSRTWNMSVLTVRMVGRMVTGDVSPKNISGPINIAQYAGYSASIGLASFLSFLAIVSLSLGILNLLPIPVLDGGQVIYQVAEAINGKPLSERVQILGQQIGIAFLVLIMGFAFYNDLTRVFS